MPAKTKKNGTHLLRPNAQCCQAVWAVWPIIMSHLDLKELPYQISECSAQIKVLYGAAENGQNGFVLKGQIVYFKGHFGLCL